MSSPGPEPRTRGNRWTWVFLGIGLVFLVVLVGWFGPRTLWETVREARPLPLVAMTVIIAAGFWLRALKWRYALGPGSRGVSLFFLAKLAGAWTPARAGEFAPLLLAEHRRLGVAAWILADRVLEVWSTLALGVAGVVLLGLAGMWGGVVLVAGALGGTVVLIVAVLRAQVLIPLLDHDRPESLRAKIAEILRRLHAEFRSLGSRFPGIALLTALAKLTDVYAVVLLCQAFGYSVSFWLVCAARCAHALVSAVPITPDVSGAPYAAQAVVLHEFGAMPYATLTAALALEAALIYAVLYMSALVGTRHADRSRQKG